MRFPNVQTKDKCPNEHYPSQAEYHTSSIYMEKTHPTEEDYPTRLTWEPASVRYATSHVHTIKEKKINFMEKLVTPPWRGTSPSRCSPPPCEQALISCICQPGNALWDLATSHQLFGLSISQEKLVSYVFCQPGK